MKLLIEDNGHEIELDIREYLHLANVSNELGDSTKLAISQHLITSELARIEQLTKINVINNIEEDFALTEEHNNNLIITEESILVSPELPIGTAFEVYSYAEILLDSSETFYTTNNSYATPTGYIRIVKISNNKWLIT